MRFQSRLVDRPVIVSILYYFLSCMSNFHILLFFNQVIFLLLQVLLIVQTLFVLVLTGLLMYQLAFFNSQTFLLLNLTLLLRGFVFIRIFINFLLRLLPFLSLILGKILMRPKKQLLYSIIRLLPSVKTYNIMSLFQ